MDDRGSLATTSSSGSLLLLMTSLSADFSPSPDMSSSSSPSSSSSKQTPLFIAVPTIAGIPVSTFSYIFLAVGGAAPILFIIVVVISMKCYWWRKYRRYRRYLGHLPAYNNQAADSEYTIRSPVIGPSSCRSEFGFVHAQFPDAHLLHPCIGASSCTGDLSVLRYVREIPDARLSASNPNVYFRETPLLVVGNGIHVKDGHGLGMPSTGALSNGAVRSSLAGEPSDCQPSQPDGGSCQSRAGSCQSPNDSRRSITSEEARALACFDHIYNDLDLNPREPATDAESAIRKKAGGQYNLAYNDSDGSRSGTQCHEHRKLHTRSCPGIAPETASKRNCCDAPSENRRLSSTEGVRGSGSGAGGGLEAPIASTVDHVLRTSNGNVLRSPAEPGQDPATYGGKTGGRGDGVDGGSWHAVNRSEGMKTDVDRTVAEHSYITCDNSDSQSEIIYNGQAQMMNSAHELSRPVCPGEQ